MKLSIITINYNNLAGLKKTVENVLAQTWRDFEWIIVDGGSTDGSKEYIESLAQSLSEGTAIDSVQWHVERFSLPGFTAENLKGNASELVLNQSIDNRQSSIANRPQRFLWCSEPDKGVYNAMNKGIAKASGEYVNFMNSGDCFAFSGTLKGVWGKERTADIVYGYMMMKSLNGDYHNIYSMRRNLSWEFFYRDTFPHQSSYIKRNLFDKIGYYDESYRMLADWKWFAVAVLKYGASYEFIPKKLSIYECGGISEDESWRVEWKRLQEETFGCIKKETDLFQLQELKDIQSHLWSRLLYKIIRKIVNCFSEIQHKKDILNLTERF